MRRCAVVSRRPRHEPNPVTSESAPARVRRLVVGPWVRNDVDVHLPSHPKAGRTRLGAFLGADVSASTIANAADAGGCEFTRPAAPS